MVERKELSKGNELALFVFSKGYCYFPGCPVRAFREEDGDMFTNVQRAHINAVKKVGARWLDLPSHVINSYKNVMLMCQPHHIMIDSDEDRFPAELLFTWKAEREGSQMDALRGLEGLSEADFEGMLKGSVTVAKKEIMAALGDLSQEHREVATLLKEFINGTFTGPTLDADQVDMLFQASHMLHSMSLPDQTAQLMMAAHHLQNFDVERLSSATSRLPDVEPFTNALFKLDDNAGALRQISSAVSEDNLNRLSFHTREIESVTSNWTGIKVPDAGSIESAVARLERARDELVERAEAQAHESLPNVIDSHRWKDYMLWGFIAGIVFTLAVAGGIWYLVANGGSAK